MGKTWKKIAARVSGIMISAAVMAGCISSDTALAVERTYTVESGDTLSKIAQEQYGSDQWEILYELNKDQIANPNRITTGQTLILSATSSDLVEQSQCSVSMLVKYLYSNRADNAVESFLRNGEWPEGVSVPISDNVLTQNGSIDWSQAPQDGYLLDAQGNAVKETCIPQIGEVFDRYGSEYGRYACPVIDGQAYAYNKRSLPYVEDVSSYHQYQVCGDISQYGGGQMTVWRGTAAAAFGQEGGAIQYQFPASMKELCQHGILREIN